MNISESEVETESLFKTLHYESTKNPKLKTLVSNLEIYYENKFDLYECYFEVIRLWMNVYSICDNIKSIKSEKLKSKIVSEVVKLTQWKSNQS